MFGIDDAIAAGIGGIISGGASLLGGQASNAANAQQAMWNNIGNANMLGASMTYNASQADIQRKYQTAAMQDAMAYNAGQAGQQMNFQTAALRDAMNFNATQADIQRQYNTEMSSTAYQRAVADMKKAGLNPILSAGTGGAASPPGASASVSPVSGASGSVGAPSGASGSVGVGSSVSSRMADVFSPAVSSALQGAKIAADLKSTVAGNQYTDAQRRLTDQNVNKSNADTDVANQTISNLRATYDNIVAQIEVIKNQAADYAASARQRDADAQLKLKQAQTAGKDVSGFGFHLNPGGWWPSGLNVSPPTSSFSPGNPGTYTPPAPASPAAPNSNSVWGEGGGDPNSHSWVRNPDGSKGVQLW